MPQSDSTDDVDSPYTATAEDARNADTFGSCSRPITPRFAMDSLDNGKLHRNQSWAPNVLAARADEEVAEERRVARLFAEIDTGRAGVISFVQFQSWWKRSADVPPTDTEVVAARKAFVQHDASQSGTIAAPEAAALIKFLGLLYLLPGSPPAAKSPGGGEIESPHTATAEDARNADTFGDASQRSRRVSN
jgi:hypothetical protein